MILGLCITLPKAQTLSRPSPKIIGHPCNATIFWQPYMTH
jgi:hypothetical protein